MLKIHSNIRHLRKQHKLKQSELGEKLNVKSNTISAYERGDVLPTIDKLIILANLFDVSLDELVGREHKGRKKLRKEIEKELMEIKCKLYEKYEL